jgi:hypothetical protein
VSRKTLGLAVVLATAAAVAGASWSAQGTGAAKAKAGQLVAVTASPANPSTELFPGGSADSALTLNNPNPVAMVVSSIVGAGPVTSDTADCNAESVSFANQNGAWEVAKNAQLTVHLPSSVTMSLSANDACQGATFTIPVAVTASVSGQGGSADPTTTTSTTTAPPAQFAWQSSNYVFPNTEVNTTANFNGQAVLRNIGGTPATVERGTFGSSEFQLIGSNCFSAPLAPGQSCSIAASFRPAAVGPRSAPFEVRPLGTTQPWATITARGEGVTPPNIVINPGSKDFGTVTSSTVESPGFLFQITNTGGAPAQNVAPQLTGPDARDFQVKSSTCGTFIHPGTTCSITVSFRPQTHPGAHSATLRVNYYNAVGMSFAANATLTGNAA